MSHSSKKNRRRAREQRVSKATPASGEDPRSVAVTVGWMMSTLATGGAMCFSALAHLLTRSLADHNGQPNPLTALPGLLLFMALVTSVLTLAIIPVVYHLRPVRPPRTVTAGSICVAVAPWFVVLVQTWQ